MAGAVQHLRNTLRDLNNNPGTSTVIILALALGIAVNAAIFSLVDTVLFKPLPGKNPQRLVQLLTLEHRGSSPSNGVAYPIYKQYRDEVKGLADLAAYHNIPVYFSTGDSEAQQVIGAVVTGNFFRVLDVNAKQGACSPTWTTEPAVQIRWSS
jgi:putative ABC transport system permease protein